jgi:hypothetical protein
MKDIDLKRITGHANQQMQQFQQIATAGKVTVNFYGFIPVGGNCTISELTNLDSTDGLGYFGVATGYQNMYYPGNFKSITLSAGAAILYLNEQ